MFVGFVNTKVLFLPFCSSPWLPSSSVFLLLFLCSRELRSLELTLISKVVVQPSAESRFFFF